jgi:hypothetical protein
MATRRIATRAAAATDACTADSARTTRTAVAGNRRIPARIADGNQSARDIETRCCCGTPGSANQRARTTVSAFPTCPAPGSPTVAARRSTAH